MYHLRRKLFDFVSQTLVDFDDFPELRRDVMSDSEYLEKDRLV